MSPLPLLITFSFRNASSLHEEIGEGVKYHYYANEEFNLHFGYPKSDTCSTCEHLHIQLNSLRGGSQEKVELQQKHEDHLRSAEQFYSSLCLNTEMAKLNDHIYTISFDFQSKICHYCIFRLVIYFTCSNCGYTFLECRVAVTTKGLCCWPESTAKRGSNEVISYLDHFLSVVPRFVNILYLYSHGCSGQNECNALFVHLSVNRPISAYMAHVPSYGT